MTTLTYTFSNFGTYDSREGIARLGAVVLGGMLLFTAGKVSLEHQSLPAPSFRVALAEIPAAPVSEPSPQMRSAQLPQPKPLLKQPQQTTPVAPSPSPLPSLVSVPDLPLAPVAKAIPPAPVAAVRGNSGAEGRFAREVYSRIEQKKVYPSEARDLGMTGVVGISYVLDRSGGVLKAVVIASSGYALLDQAALRAVRSARFNNMPEDAWTGEKSKEFRTKLVFSINY